MSSNRIPQSVLQAAGNPFSHVNNNYGSDDEEENHQQHYQTQQQNNNYAAANNNNNANATSPQSPMSPKKAAQVAQALQLQNPDQREAALRRLYGDSGVFGSGDDENNNNNSQQRRGRRGGGGVGSPYSVTGDSDDDQQDEQQILNLPGGAGSLDELLSRAAALDRECFDLQNEVVRWEKEIQECSQDINRVNGSLHRYARELETVEQSVAELNGWFEDHTCANDPERYQRVSELNRDVSMLNMRMQSLESQLSTLLEGTMSTASQDGLGGGFDEDDNNNYNNNNNYSSSRNNNRNSSSFLDGAMNNDDLNKTPPRNNRDPEVQRMGELLQMVSPSSRGNNNNNDTASGSSRRKNPATSSHLVPVASPVRLPSNASTHSIKQYIKELEQKTLEQDVLMLRVKEATDKRDRYQDEERKNEFEIQALRQKLENAGIALPQAPIQHRTSRALRKNQSHTAASLLSSGNSETTKRTIRLPSGILRELTKELNASVRQIAHRCGVGEIAVEIANDATLLHCRGIVRAINAFEDEVKSAAEHCKRNRAFGGMVTYTVPQVNAVVADSTNKIAALLQPDQSPEKKSYW